jgi:hypothetical protein
MCANILANNLSCEVTAKQLLWGKTELSPNCLFDLVIAADWYVLFFITSLYKKKKKRERKLTLFSLFLEHFHNDLLATLQQILKQDGAALFIAPRRGASMSIFSDKAKLQGFDVAIEEDYDAQVSREHLRFQSEPESGYNPDIHFPVLLKLCKLKI